MEYRFEEIQNLQFVVYDVDNKHHVDNIDKQQLLGTMECTLAEIMTAGVHLTKSLKLKGVDLLYLLKVLVYCNVSSCGCTAHCMFDLLSHSLSMFCYCLPSSSPDKPAGAITIQAEEVRDSKLILPVDIQLSAPKLEKKDVFGKVSFDAGPTMIGPTVVTGQLSFFKMQSDPCIEKAKAQEGGDVTLVHTSQPIMTTLSPK